MLRLHYDLSVVEHGPLPPHERTWRHPSELAAEEHAVARAEPTGGSTRAFAFASGGLGLLAVGSLIVAVTPERSAAPVAVSATTTPVDRSPSIAVSPSPASGTGPIALRGRREATATPIGEGRLAVVTAADLAATGELSDVGAAIEVEVPSGRMVDARVVAHDGDAVLVQLERPEPGLALADEPPAGDEIVLVMAEPPVTIVLDDLAGLEVDEGTAVLDRTGDLVGLCSQDRDDATRLLPVRDLVATEAESPEPEAQPDDEGPPAGGPVNEQPADATSVG